MATITVSNIAQLQAAGRDAKPGDTVLVNPGNYAVDVNNSAYVLNITASGTANSRITFKAADPNNKPVINVRNYVGVLVLGSYVDIDGFKIVGNSKTDFSGPNGLTDAKTLIAKDPSNPYTAGSGISIGSTYLNKYANHVTVKNSIVQDCTGAGIGSVRADDVTIENNEVFGNGFYDPGQTSGISLYQSGNSDSSNGNTVSKNGVMKIINNKVHDNKNLVPAKDGRFTDGNGIIIDDNSQSQNVYKFNPMTNKMDLLLAKVPYEGKTIIQGNEVYNNGARGITSYISSNVEISGNKVYNNFTTKGFSNQTAGGGADISATINDNPNDPDSKNPLNTSKNIVIYSNDLGYSVGKLGVKIGEGVGVSYISAGVSGSPNPDTIDISNNFSSLKSGLTFNESNIFGQAGNDFINCDYAKLVRDFVFYDNGDGQDQVYNFSLNQDQIHFKGINNINVKKNGSNTEFRDVATGSLLMTTVGTTGFAASTAINTDLGDFNAKYNLFGSNFTFS